MSVVGLTSDQIHSLRISELNGDQWYSHWRVFWKCLLEEYAFGNGIGVPPFLRVSFLAQWTVKTHEIRPNQIQFIPHKFEIQFVRRECRECIHVKDGSFVKPLRTEFAWMQRTGEGVPDTVSTRVWAQRQEKSKTGKWIPPFSPTSNDYKMRCVNSKMDTR